MSKGCLISDLESLKKDYLNKINKHLKLMRDPNFATKGYILTRNE